MSDAQEQFESTLRRGASFWPVREVALGLMRQGVDQRAVERQLDEYAGQLQRNAKAVRRARQALEGRSLTRGFTRGLSVEKQLAQAFGDERSVRPLRDSIAILLAQGGDDEAIGREIEAYAQTLERHAEAVLQARRSLADRSLSEFPGRDADGRIHMREWFERALRTERSIWPVREVIIGLLSNGAPRDEILSQLQQHVNALEHGGREEERDVVLDAMDCLTGWCGPSMRL